MRKTWAAVAAAAAVLVGGSLAAGSSVASAAAEADGPTSIVEDYAYPGRDQILAEHGLKLKTGDGNILWVECSVAGDKIKIESYDFVEPVCFQLRGEHGFLSLEIARTTYIWSDNEPLTATVQYAGEGTETKQVQENYWVAVGESENRPSATILEIRA